jgi:hypothetical protein
LEYATDLKERQNGATEGRRHATAQMLVMVTPGGFNQFFEELSSLNRGLAAPDLVRTEQLMNAYGIELLGPPLS